MFFRDPHTLRHSADSLQTICRQCGDTVLYPGQITPLSVQHYAFTNLLIQLGKSSNCTRCPKQNVSPPAFVSPEPLEVTLSDNVVQQKRIVSASQRHYRELLHYACVLSQPPVLSCLWYNYPSSTVSPVTVMRGEKSHSTDLQHMMYPTVAQCGQIRTADNA